MGDDAVEINQAGPKDEGEDHRDQTDDEVDHNGLQSAEVKEADQHWQPELGATKADQSAKYPDQAAPAERPNILPDQAMLLMSSHTPRYYSKFNKRWKMIVISPAHRKKAALYFDDPLHTSMPKIHRLAIHHRAASDQKVDVMSLALSYGLFGYAPLPEGTVQPYVADYQVCAFPDDLRGYVWVSHNHHSFDRVPTHKKTWRRRRAPRFVSDDLPDFICHPRVMAPSDADETSAV